MNPPSELIKDAFTRHAAVVKDSAEQITADIEHTAIICAEAAGKNRRIFICGNGGSAADSQHFAAEWTCRYKNERGPLPAIALTTDTSALTAIGNDYNFDEIFSRPLAALGAPGDVLIGITTSGTSKNILKAFAVAKDQQMKTIAFTGARGTQLRNMVDAAIIVPSQETARIQEIHELAYHAICEYVDACLEQTTEIYESKTGSISG